MNTPSKKTNINTLIFTTHATSHLSRLTSNVLRLTSYVLRLILDPPLKPLPPLKRHCGEFRVVLFSGDGVLRDGFADLLVYESVVEAGVSGMIIPDLPFDDYQKIVKPIADRYDLRVIMLITPETSEERIRFIDQNTDGFIYMVSSAAITGTQQSFDDSKQAYFRRINQMNLRNPRMIGFGISNRQTLQSAQQNAAGAIIGSKFVTLLNESNGDADEALNRLFAALSE